MSWAFGPFRETKLKAKKFADIVAISVVSIFTSGAVVFFTLAIIDKPIFGLILLGLALLIWSAIRVQELLR